MDAISLWLPWPWWIKWGFKTIETRLHDRFKRLAGKRIAIHAAHKIDMAYYRLASRWLTSECLTKTLQHLIGVAQFRGTIICTAFVDHAEWLTKDCSSAALIDCEHTKRFGLFLRDIQVPDRVIKCPGRQGIFHVDI